MWGVGACLILIRHPQHTALTTSRAGENYLGILSPQILVTSKKVNLDVSEIITNLRCLPSKERTAPWKDGGHFRFPPPKWQIEASDAETISDGQVGTQPWLPSLVVEGLYLGNMWIYIYYTDWMKYFLYVVPYLLEMCLLNWGTTKSVFWCIFKGKFCYLFSPPYRKNTTSWTLVPNWGEEPVWQKFDRLS